MAGQVFFGREQFVYREPTARVTNALFTGDAVHMENFHGVRFTIDIAAVGTASQTYVVEYKDPIGGDWVSLLESAAKSSTGTFIMTVGPGVATVSNVSLNAYAPAIVRLVVKSGSTADTITDSVYIEKFAA